MNDVVEIPKVYEGYRISQDVQAMGQHYLLGEHKGIIKPYAVWRFDGENCLDKQEYTLKEAAMMDMFERAAAIVPETSLDNSLLPISCFSVHPTSNELIVIRRDREGYYKTDLNSRNRAANRQMASFMNRRYNISKTQEAAMFGGCLNGWDGPEANPGNYTKQGKLRGKEKDYER